MNKKQKHHQSIIPGNTNAVNVIGSTREDLSFALKTWKRKIKHSKILERTKENKSIYTLVFNQGVLGLPDKYYYLNNLNNLNLYQELCKHLSKLLKIGSLCLLLLFI